MAEKTSTDSWWRCSGGLDEVQQVVRYRPALLGASPGIPARETFQDYTARTLEDDKVATHQAGQSVAAALFIQLCI